MASWELNQFYLTTTIGIIVLSTLSQGIIFWPEETDSEPGETFKSMTHTAHSAVNMQTDNKYKALPLTSRVGVIDSFQSQDEILSKLGWIKQYEMKHKNALVKRSTRNGENRKRTEKRRRIFQERYRLFRQRKTNENKPPDANREITIIKNSELQESTRDSNVYNYHHHRPQKSIEASSHPDRVVNKLNRFEKKTINKQHGLSISGKHINENSTFTQKQQINRKPSIMHPTPSQTEPTIVPLDKMNIRKEKFMNSPEYTKSTYRKEDNQNIHNFKLENNERLDKLRKQRILKTSKYKHQNKAELKPRKFNRPMTTSLPKIDLINVIPATQTSPSMRKGRNVSETIYDVTTKGRVVSEMTSKSPFLSKTQALDYLTSYESIKKPRRWPVRLELPTENVQLTTTKSFPIVSEEVYGLDSVAHKIENPLSVSEMPTTLKGNSQDTMMTIAPKTKKKNKNKKRRKGCKSKNKKKQKPGKRMIDRSKKCRQKIKHKSLKKKRRHLRNLRWKKLKGRSDSFSPDTIKFSYASTNLNKELHNLSGVATLATFKVNFTEKRAQADDLVNSSMSYSSYHKDLISNDTLGEINSTIISKTFSTTSQLLISSFKDLDREGKVDNNSSSSNQFSYDNISRDQNVIADLSFDNSSVCPNLIVCLYNDSSLNRSNDSSVITLFDNLKNSTENNTNLFIYNSSLIDQFLTYSQSDDNISSELNVTLSFNPNISGSAYRESPLSQFPKDNSHSATSEKFVPTIISLMKTNFKIIPKENLTSISTGMPTTDPTSALSSPSMTSNSSGILSSTLLATDIVATAKPPTTSASPSHSTTPTPISRWRLWALRRRKKLKKRNKNRGRGTGSGSKKNTKYSATTMKPLKTRGSVAGSLVVINTDHQNTSGPPKSATESTKSPFIGHKTAYDFLSGQRGRLKAYKSEERRESHEFNSVMAESMCEVFNKHFVPTNIGGKCV